MADDIAGKLCGGAFCAVIIAIIVLIAISFDSIEPEELGLKYDTNKEVVTDNNGEAFRQGNHFVGVGCKFLKFPGVVTNMDFRKLPGRTKEGLEIHLNMAMSYQLDPKSVMKLYRVFGYEEFTPMLKRYTEDILKMEVTKYSAVDFITTQKQNITKAIKTVIMQKVVPKTVFVKVKNFQIMEVILAKEFEQSVNDNYMLSQEVKTKTLDRARLMVEWNTTLMKEKQRVNVDMREAEAEGAKIVLEARSASNSITQKALSNSQTRIIQAESNAATMIVDAKSNRDTSVLDAKASASKLLTEAKSRAKEIVLQADTYAQTIVLQAQADAESIKVENDAFVAQYEKAQELQAESYVKIWEALGKSEDKFLDMQTLKAVKSLDWKEWTINSDKVDPFTLLS